MYGRPTTINNTETFAAVPWIITHGADGCAISAKDAALRVPAFKVKTVDTTGAGDVFHGAFAVGLLESWPVSAVTAFASAVAAMKCRSLGGRAGIPSRAEALSFLRERKIAGPWQP